MKNGCKPFVSSVMDRIGIEPFFDNRLEDVIFAQVRLRMFNSKGKLVEETMQLISELHKYILYLYEHIAQLEKDKQYLKKKDGVMPAKVFALIYEENSDNRCGAEVTLFGRYTDAVRAMRMRFAETLEELADRFDEAELTSETSAHINCHIDSYVWHIEEKEVIE